MSLDLATGCGDNSGTGVEVISAGGKNVYATLGIPLRDL